MTIELQALVWACVTLIVLLGVQGALVPINQGFAWGLGSRDEPRDMTAFQGRMRRIVANHIEGLVVFAGLVLAAHLAGISSSTTQIGAILFVLARVLFAVTYMAGVPVVRSVIWGVGTFGILMIAVDVIAASI
ncbi:MAG: MAPEG family protein [Pseudomonadota bacterium]